MSARATTAMPDRNEALRRLRAAEPIGRAGIAGSALADGLTAAGVRFAAVGGHLEDRWHRAIQELDACISPTAGGEPVLREGGVYPGSWIESTGTISADMLWRWSPEVARSTLLQFADHQRADGLLPYKVTADGPAFSQIQIVSPLARVVWRHYQATGRDLRFLRTMYDAMVRNDEWLAQHRDTRGTGAVEAFCTYDTGHDLSPRFWFAPERCFAGDALHCDPESATLPYVAPDLTANVACQRTYLARIADELGEDPQRWHDAAAASLHALWEQCYHNADEIFYDRDRRDEPVRIASDVLLRVLACEVGDDAFFVAALRRYLMNTQKFLSHHGFTSVAMDDPRFDHDASRNSWGGPVNFLALLRAPDAFEHHGNVAELAAASAPVMAALAKADRFPQCLDPWSGDAGFTQQYSPSILWFLDALERWSGILPLPDGGLWFSGLAPTRLAHGQAATAVAAARTTSSGAWELAADDTRVDVFREGAEVFSFPRGWRLMVDAAGEPRCVVGLASAPVSGQLTVGDQSVRLTVAPNERIEIDGGALVVGRTDVAFVAPVFD